jgi:hypothetical protein
MFISVGLCARATGVAGAPGNYKKGTPGNNNVAKSVHIPYREFGWFSLDWKAEKFLSYSAQISYKSPCFIRDDPLPWNPIT